MTPTAISPASQLPSSGRAQRKHTARDGNVAALAATRTVITWDMRGHGDSDSPESQDAYTHEECVGDLVAILDRCDVGAAAIGGLSLGGYMSLDFYRTHPERTRCLLLFDTGPGFKNDEARARWNANAENIAAARELGMETVHFGENPFVAVAELDAILDRRGTRATA